jgi:outer membrane protein assembly factor BamE (lipoprotein component of BamABCDE complex)
LAILALTSLVAAGWLADVIDSAFGHEYARFRAIEIGMSEADVRERLGRPHRIYYRATAPADYYAEGYEFKRRAITNKVFIHFATEPIAYVYFDEDNRVEEVFVGGS